VEKPEAGSGPSLPAENQEDWRMLTRERAEAIRAQIEQEREEAKRKRRAGRPKGELSPSLVQKLGDCNVLQLQSAKKLCDRHIKRQRKPPIEQVCGDRYTVHVLHSVTLKKALFRLEFRRTSLRADKVYVNGPYVRRYWWDGSIVRSQHVKKGDSLRCNLPKKVWLAFRDLLDRPENEQIRRRLTDKLQAESRNGSISG
jgi:hypothetical protein